MLSLNEVMELANDTLRVVRLRHPEYAPLLRGTFFVFDASIEDHGYGGTANWGGRVAMAPNSCMQSNRHEVAQMILHELAHVIAERTTPGTGHGVLWQRINETLGGSTHHKMPVHNMGTMLDCPDCGVAYRRNKPGLTWAKCPRCGGRMVPR